jgi:hypothetical protein
VTTASLACLENGDSFDFTGECSFETLKEAAASKGCSEDDIFEYLMVEDASSANEKVKELCGAATDSFFQFSSIAKSGYQFDREFMNGGSDWNNMFNPDLSRVQMVEDNIVSKRGITFPEYLYNFDTSKSCDSMAVMCCWTADSSSEGGGSCTDAAGCQDKQPIDNTDICYVDIDDSVLASHTASGTAIYPGDAEGDANCMGFTWTNDPSDPSSLYKGNLLFEVAMRYGLKDNGYTRSVPHAPMCACVEQMPVVSHADCKDLEATITWTVSKNEWGYHLSSSTDDITFNDCSGQGLAEHYETIHSNDGGKINDRVKAVCKDAESSFISAKGFMKDDEIEWVKVAGKGSFSDASLSEQLLDGTHSSMTRVEFEELWAKSHQILLRRCKYCNGMLRYAYYRRNDENGLPANVDILYDVKEHWHMYENNTVGLDFNLFSTYDDAVQGKNPWSSVNANYHSIGFARNSGPSSFMNGQWNTWDTPVFEKHYGQSDVGFYVAMPPDTV